MDEKEDKYDVHVEMCKFLNSGGYKGTITIHLKNKGIKVGRKILLNTLHCYAEPGEYVTIGGIRQKSWIM